MKYIIVSGGVISGLGKGIVASSIGVVLKKTCNVTCIKIDPYLNVDAGTMSPYEHGEVYVLEDGGETDLDMGNYERFVDLTLTSNHNITSGKIYKQIIDKERKGDYLGATVQVIPHFTDILQDILQKTAAIPVEPGTEPNLCIIELGGTVGDIISAPFIEGLRQFQWKVGRENVCFVHLTLVPTVNGLQKSKPTQHSIAALRTCGIVPDMIVCRSAKNIEESIRDKISMFCQVDKKCVLSVPDVSNVWEVPSLLEQSNFVEEVNRILKLSTVQVRSSRVHSISRLAKASAALPDQEIKIALVGKYTKEYDAYLSVQKALQHSSLDLNIKLDVTCVDAENIDWEVIHNANGIIVPGGFGIRGIENIIQVIKYARIQKIPFFGICLGLQLAVIEFSRNVLGNLTSQSEEFGATGLDRVVIHASNLNKKDLGGTMSLGCKETHLLSSSKVSLLYNNVLIRERHRHRYEVNPDIVQACEQHGLRVVGKTSQNRISVMELQSYQFYVGTQFHPEFTSRPDKSNPLFKGFVQSAYLMTK